jgi:hypothetical protein
MGYGTLLKTALKMGAKGISKAGAKLGPKYMAMGAGMTGLGIAGSTSIGRRTLGKVGGGFAGGIGALGGGAARAVGVNNPMKAMTDMFFWVFIALIVMAVLGATLKIIIARQSLPDNDSSDRRPQYEPRDRRPQYEPRDRRPQYEPRDRRPQYEPRAA